MNAWPMFRQLTILFAIAFPAAAQTTAAPDPLLGSWQGTLVAGPQRLEVALHVRRDGDGYAATFDSITQGANGIPVSTLTFANGALTAEMPIGARYTAKLEAGEGDAPHRLVGTWHQGGGKLPLTLRAVAEVSRPKRPQTPIPPFPYAIEEVRFGHDPARGLDASFHVGAAPDGATGHVTLAGTLTLPKGDGPHPAVALISGSGPQDRDESLLGHQPFWILADHLSRHGIAVLRYDDRGTAASTGDFNTATSADFAVDAAAALRYLASRDDIDAERLGLIGHSEGGIVAPLVATGPDAARVAFAVLLAPPAVNIREVILHQSRLVAAAEGADAAAIDTDVALSARILDAIAEHADPEAREAAVRAIVNASFAARPADEQDPEQFAAVLREAGSTDTPWMRWLLGHEPTDALRTMRCPVLAVFGAKDLQVDPAQNRPPLEAALRAAERDDVRVVTLDGLNHLFQPATTGSPSEYGAIEETIAPHALELVRDWILAQVRR